MTNISYNGIKNKDYENRTFVIDIFAYLILYFNPYNVNGKFETELERSYINVLWSLLLPQNFYIFVAKKENIQLLNKKNAKFQDAVEIVKLYIEVEDKNTTQQEQFDNLKMYLKKYIKMYQLIFSNLFPKYYSKFDSRGVENNIEFTSYYSNYLNQKNIVEWQTNNQLWEEKTKNYESYSDVEIVDSSKIKKDEKEEKKKKSRKRKIVNSNIGFELELDSEEEKKFYIEKLKENDEKLKKLKKNI